MKINFFLLRFTDDEVDEMYREAPIKNGMFDYTEFTRSPNGSEFFLSKFLCRILKHGANDKE